MQGRRSRAVSRAHDIGGLKNVLLLGSFAAGDHPVLGFGWWRSGQVEASAPGTL
jgi:hypothetical protein